MEKIKAVLSGSSSHDTHHSSSANDKATEGHTSTSKPGGHHHRADELGADHTQGRHDPEVEAKEATSAAGNYPYWGDLPTEGKDSHSAAPAAVTSSGDAHSHHKDAGLATGAAAAASGVAGHRAGVDEHRALEPQGTSSSASHNTLPDRTREAVALSAAAQDPSATHGVKHDHNKGELVAAGAAGTAGAAYLGTRHHDDDNHAKLARAPGAASGPTSASPGTLDPGYASQIDSSTTAAPHTSTATAPQKFTNIDDTSYAARDYNNSHGVVAAALAASVGGGARYVGVGHNADGHHQHKSTEDRPSTVQGRQGRATTTSGLTSSQANPTTGGGIHNTVVGAGSSQDPARSTHAHGDHTGVLGTSGHAHDASSVDPREQASISGALGGPTSGDHHDKRDIGVAGAGLGAGALAAEQKHRHHEHDKTHKEGHSLFGSSHSKEDTAPKKEGHSLFGASSHKDDKPMHSSQPTAASQSAQLAAQQAWNNQHQGTATTTTTTATSGSRHSPVTEAEKATSAAGNYPHHTGGSVDQSSAAHATTDRSSHTGAAIGAVAAGAGATAAYSSQHKDASTPHHHHHPTEAEKATSAAGNYPHLGGSGRSDGASAATATDRSSHASHASAAVGPASGVGLGAAGATAAYYGQGKEHDQNPRNNISEKVADRALGSDGGAHGPSSSQGREFPLSGGGNHGGVGAAGLSSGSGPASSKVVHQCHSCGADNDISGYFKKDAAFRIGS